jgi:hypothetical protein
MAMSELKLYGMSATMSLSAPRPKRKSHRPFAIAN